MNSTVLLAGVSALALCAAPAMAADFTERFEGREPAVSGINGKLEGGYTWLRFNGTNANLWEGAGAISIPIGQQFGLQIDGGIGITNTSGQPNVTLAGAGAHLFWRDPSIGLVGFYGDGVHLSTSGANATVWRYGVEAELYLDRFSLEGFVGGDHLRGFGSVRNTFSAEAIAALYATDNFRIHAGVAHRFNQTYGRVGAEAILPFAANNVAVFADGTFGRNTTTIGGGIRVYFGESGKSLIDRHRRDDPRIDLFDGLQFLNSAPPPPPPPPPPPCPCGCPA